MGIKRFNWLDVLVLVAIVLFGLINLPYPFGGDQALFTVTVKKMSHGGILYRDIWDWKQPGIFVFYLVGGTLFGFDEIGIHTFELVYMAIFSLVLILTLKSYYKNQLIGTLAPLLTIGVYYAISQQMQLTQVEALVGFPMFLSLWSASGLSQFEGSQRLRFFLSGFMGGVVILFKLIFLPILMAFWISALVENVVRKQERLPTALIRIGAPIATGVLLPLLTAFCYFAWHDIINLVYRTFFVYPPRLLEELPTSGFPQLKKGLKWFIQRFASIMALGCIGACMSLSIRRDLMTFNLVLWCIVGFIIIMVQRVSLWSYHYLLLLVPLGILAAQGLDFLWRHIDRLWPSVNTRRAHIALALSLAFLFSPILGTLAVKGITLIRKDFAIKREDRIEYKSSIDKKYQKKLEDVAFLSRAESFSGPIYAFGDPIYYLLSGRGQAIQIHGWAAETLLPEQWALLTKQLSEALPSYIFIENFYLDLDLILNRSPETADFIERNYRMLRKSDEGEWYVIQASSITDRASYQTKENKGRSNIPPYRATE